jgi:hypothetical protein
MQLNYHPHIGLKPGYGLIYENYGKSKVYGIRWGWRLWTLAKVMQ